MDTGTRSLRNAFRKGSWSDWPLAIGFSLFSRLLIVRARVESKRASLETSSKVCASRAEGERRQDLNMRTESKTKLAQLVTQVAIPRHLIGFRIQPARGRFGAHP